MLIHYPKYGWLFHKYIYCMMYLLSLMFHFIVAKFKVCFRLS